MNSLNMNKKAKLKTILRSLVNNKGSFCTLCYNSIDGLRNFLNITDKCIYRDGNEKSILDILNFTFTQDVSTDFLSTNVICLKCAESALSSYLFIKMVKENTRQLSHIIKKLIDVVDNSLEEKLECFKAMYLLNEDSKFQTCYDTKCEINSVETAKLRLDTIASENNYEEINLEPELLKDEYTQLTKKTYKTNTLVCERNNKQLIKKTSKYNTYVDMCEKDGKITKCKLCLKVFATMEYFTKHYKRIHAPKTVKCLQCPRLFGSKAILKQHRLECHADAICTECGKAFNNIHYLRQHELSHKTNFPCQICKRKYKSKETYNIHLRLKICGQKQRKSQAEAVFTCDICNKKFCHKSSLRLHIVHIHGNRKTYICEICNKKCNSQSQLNTHVLKHTKVKNFLCTMCESRFRTKEGLTIHTRSHTGERPYKCVECEDTFVSTSQRSRHVQRYHKLQTGKS